MSATILEQLISELTIFYNITPKKIEQLFKEELSYGNSEEDAADNVRKRIDFLIM